MIGTRMGGQQEPGDLRQQPFRPGSDPPENLVSTNKTKKNKKKTGGFRLQVGQTKPSGSGRQEAQLTKKGLHHLPETGASWEVVERCRLIFGT